MCGICGKFNFLNGRPVEDDLLDRMCRQLWHRGPDDQGMYIKNHIGLGMRRLSIIDVAGGHQPIHNEDKTIWVVCNGEIYNFLELRDDLERRGHVFLTNSDTEVIVHAYEAFGMDFLGKLRGMFAIALWDSDKQRLVLARDRVGKKPLYYTVSNGALLFASEIKSLLQDAFVSRQVDPRALDLYLTYQFVPAPLTMFQGILKLPPASMLVCQKGAITVEPYWRLDDTPADTFEPEECSERLIGLLRESVKLRMISDVPLGAFLSGGLDSSLVTALMAEQSRGPVKTFSIGFEEEEFSELQFARAVAERFGTDHQELIVKPDIAELIPKLVGHFDEPFGDSSAIPTYYLAEMTRRSVTVALSGDGGDELFAGYWKYPLFEQMIRQPQLISRVKTGLHRGFSVVDPTMFREGSTVGRLVRSMIVRTMSPESRNFHWLSYFDPYSKRRMYSDEMTRHLFSHNAESWYAGQLDRSHRQDAMSRILMADFISYLPDDLLTKVDMTSMANSLEVRCPLLDHHLVEYAARIPWSYKVRHGGTKWILKKACAGLIPGEILGRHKQGFAIPVNRWLRTSLKQYAYDTLMHGKGTGVETYFVKDYVERLLAAHMSGVADYGGKLWLLLIFAVWHQRCIEGQRWTQ